MPEGLIAVNCHQAFCIKNSMHICYNQIKLLFLLVIVFLLPGCIMPLQPSPALPDFSQVEEGDIILTTNGNTQSWLFALAAKNDFKKSTPPFSHAEMAFRNGKGKMMLGGVFAGSLQSDIMSERFPKFYRVAVFRANALQEKRKKAAVTLFKMLNDPSINTAEFDYSMSYEPGKTENLFCAGIINEVCRLSGLAYPFGITDWDNNGLTSHVEEIVGTKLKGLLDLNSLYKSKDYHLVLEWQNDQIENENIQLSKQIIIYLLSQYEEGWKLRTRDDFNLFLAFGDPSQVKEKFGRLKQSLEGFNDDVISTWHRLSRRGTLDGLSDDEKNDLLKVIFEKYHEKYFYIPDPAIASTQ